MVTGRRQQADGPKADDCDVLEFEIPVAFRLLNPQRRVHYSRLEMDRRHLSQLIAVATHGRRPSSPWRKVEIYAVRHSSGRCPDRDALHGGFKDLLDCLVTPRHEVLKKGGIRVTHKHGLGIIEDDAYEKLVWLEVTAEICKRGQNKTCVRIVKLPDSSPEK